MKPDEQELVAEIDNQSRRRKRFEKRTPFWRQTVYMGTLGIIFILPVVLGAYFGTWLDDRLKGYSISWTINLILLGVIIGGVNAFLFIRDKQ